MVCLTLTRAAEEYFNIHDNNHTAFGQVYVQTDDQKSGNSNAVASALSKDISLFLIATFHHSFVLYRDRFKSPRPVWDPLDAVGEVCGGDIPLFHIREALGLIGKHILKFPDISEEILESSETEMAEYVDKLDGEMFPNCLKSAKSFLDSLRDSFSKADQDEIKTGAVMCPLALRMIQPGGGIETGVNASYSENQAEIVESGEVGVEETTSPQKVVREGVRRCDSGRERTSLQCWPRGCQQQKGEQG